RSRRGVDVDHVERNAGRKSEPLALSDSEAVHAVVPAEDAAVAVADLAGGHARATADELRGLAGRYEADLLAIVLLGNCESQAPRLFTDRRLVERADRKPRARELVLRQREQKVRLVLPRVHASLQEVAVAVLVEIHLRVVPRGDCLCTERLGALHEGCELQI